MEPDLAVAVMEATVKIEQRLADGGRSVGTGFLVSDVTPDGRPRVTLITAGHVLADMPQASASLGFRILDPDSNWSFSPANLRIRDDAGRPLWTAHPDRDVAVIVVEAPSELARKALPVAYLAGDDTLSRNGVAPGAEMMALGFPRGLSSNAAGFPILRAGKIASYPVGPSAAAPTFLVDFSVFPGNSGGPVFATRAGAEANGPSEFVAGILTQQVEVGRERLDIGIVTHARYVRETIRMLDGQHLPAEVLAANLALQGRKANTTEP